MKTPPKGSTKIINAWAFYDWANSVYSLVITSAVFPIFYAGITTLKDENGSIINDNVQFLGFSFNNNALIGYVTAIAFLVVAVISPFLSGIADYVGNKKNFMKFFCYLGSFSCIGLFWFNMEQLWLGLLCYFLALVGFWASLVFYNSYLPDIAFPEQQDKASAKGFSLGYIGSVFLLLLCLVMILNYEYFGFEDEGLPTRISFVLTGLWWMGFSQVSFYYLPKGNKKQKLRKDLVFNGFKELQKIWFSLQQNEQLKKFLYAFFVYSMAVQTVMLVATYFGIQEIDWSGQDATTGLIISILLIQLIAVVGATLTSVVSEKIGNLKTLVGINIIWILICTFAYFITTPIHFYVTAAFVGLVMGGIQSLSRSTYSKMLPENTLDTTSFFSFYDVTEKIGIVIGMLLYGVMVQITGSIRDAILFLVVFFLLGVFLLLRVPKKTFQKLG